MVENKIIWEEFVRLYEEEKNVVQVLEKKILLDRHNPGQ